MQSFDVWDTLIGRWYYDPLNVFDLMGRDLQFDNFTYWRKHAEFTAINKTLDGIYEQFRELTKVTKEAAQTIKDFELAFEKTNSFRIEPTFLEAEMPYIVVSDFYYDLSQFTDLLTRHEIYPQKVYLSYAGKHDGSIWGTITEPVTAHYGDNLDSDVRTPIKYGISTRHIDFTGLNDLEKWLYSDYYKIASLARAVRLSQPTFDAVWLEAADVTIPMLVLLARKLFEFATLKGFTRILFTERDCHYLWQIFMAMYPNFDCELFYTSRECYTKASESFREYVSEIYGSRTLIVDMQGTGRTSYDFFSKYVSYPWNYYTVVDSDLDGFCPPTKWSLVHRRDGFTDRLEKLNYVNIGRVVDVDVPAPGQFIPIRAFQIDNEYVNHIERAVARARMLLFNGFETDFVGDVNFALVKLLRHLEDSRCEISYHVNHEAW